jgi:hypothetical protein
MYQDMRWEIWKKVLLLSLLFQIMLTGAMKAFEFRRQVNRAMHYGYSKKQRVGLIATSTAAIRILSLSFVRNSFHGKFKIPRCRKKFGNAKRKK